MRIIRLKLDRDVDRYLAQVSKRFGFDDAGFVQDLFAFIRLNGAGLPSKGRVEKMAKYAATHTKRVNEMSVRLLIAKRKLILEKLSKLPYFAALCKASDPLDSTERLILNFRTLYFKARQSACMSCSLMTQCDFGKQYGEVVKNITAVIDPDYKQKAHPNCPELPDIEEVNQMVMSIHAMGLLSRPSEEKLIAEEESRNSNSESEIKELNAVNEALSEKLEEDKEEDDEEGEDELDPEDINQDVVIGSGAGKGEQYDGNHDYNHIINLSESLIKRTTAAKLLIFDLGTKFSKALTKAARGKFKPVENVDVDTSQSNIRSEADLPQIEASQHGFPKQVFEQRLGKRSLTKKQYGKPESKRKLLYLLIDNSGSMGTFIGGTNPFSLFSRGALASLFALSLCDLLAQDGGVMYVRFYSSEAGVMKSASNKEDFKTVRAFIGSASYNCGGTDIPKAIRRVLYDISQAKDDLHSVELLLISDCQDNFLASDLKKELQAANVELNTLDVNQGAGDAAIVLKQISNRYYQADSNEADLEKIVKLV